MECESLLFFVMHGNVHRRSLRISTRKCHDRDERVARVYWTEKVVVQLGRTGVCMPWRPLFRGFEVRAQ
jgi:hypothetical protein